MCLAVPSKIISIQDSLAEVEMAGVVQTVGLDLVPEAKINDYVLVHAGYAIQRMDEAEAQENLRLLDELLGEDDAPRATS